MDCPTAKPHGWIAIRRRKTSIWEIWVIIESLNLISPYRFLGRFLEAKRLTGEQAEVSSKITAGRLGPALSLWNRSSFGLPYIMKVLNCGNIAVTYGSGELEQTLDATADILPRILCQEFDGRIAHFSPNAGKR
jgi:hypothetical protein